MSDLETMIGASRATGVSRQAIARWVRMGILKGVKSEVGNLIVTLVSVKAVRELSKTRKRGRPRNARKKNGDLT